MKHFTVTSQYISSTVFEKITAWTQHTSTIYVFQTVPGTGIKQTNPGIIKLVPDTDMLTSAVKRTSVTSV